jgi:hypothetical protein
MSDINDALNELESGDHLDRLSDFNDGLRAGVDFGSRIAWNKTYDPDSWPPLNTPLVGIRRGKKKNSPPWVAFFCICVESGDGDGGFEFEGFEGRWCPHPEWYIQVPDPGHYLP